MYVPGEIPCKHKENSQTSHKDPRSNSGDWTQDLNLSPTLDMSKGLSKDIWDKDLHKPVNMMLGEKVTIAVSINQKYNHDH